MEENMTPTALDSAHLDWPDEGGRPEGRACIANTRVRWHRLAHPRLERSFALRGAADGAQPAGRGGEGAWGTAATAGTAADARVIPINSFPSWLRV
jgi:hypothetical protein